MIQDIGLQQPPVLLECNGPDGLCMVTQRYLAVGRHLGETINVLYPPIVTIGRCL